MKPLEIQKRLEQGLQRHQCGQLAEAERIYQQVLAEQPENPDALHLLGVLEFQRGRYDTAIGLIRRVTALAPNYAEAHYNLGNALQGKGQIEDSIAAYRQAIALDAEYTEAYINLGIVLRKTGHLDEAVAAFRQAIAVDIDYASAHNNLGSALQEQGQLDQAIAAYGRAIVLNPNFADACNNLGNAMRGKGQLDDAISAYRRAQIINPNYAEALINLGSALTEKGELDEAIAVCRRAITLRPQLAEAHNNLGTALSEKGQSDEAISTFRQAIALLPSFAQAHNNLGNAMKIKGQTDDAIAAYRQAIALQPSFAEAHNNLGSVLKDQGLPAEAVAAFRQAISLRPCYSEAHSNLVYTLHLDPDQTVQTITQEHRRWSRQHAEPLKNFVRPHDNDPNPQRPLRVGYVSPDFRRHVVGQNLLPLFNHHDRTQYQIFCYSQVSSPDSVTRQFQQMSDGWRPIVGLSDERLANLIREDRIDILVDLSLHTAGNRLLVFARKPAPVQATYLGHCGTTGLDTIDWRLSDPYLDPPGADVSWCSEKTLRLPHTFWCYQPFDGFPQPMSPSRDSPVTFASLNNFCKVSARALDLWRDILDAVPNSRLMLSTPEGRHRQRLVELFGEHRLQLLGRRPLSEYMLAYQSIDIALDPFPYGGGITTCDSLWMGVPVVSLSGKMPMSRTGRSILSNVGLPEFIAKSTEDYIRIATELAADADRRAQLRTTLRDRMRASPLMDAPSFAKDVEAAYRQMWRIWCESASSGG